MSIQRQQRQSRNRRVTSAASPQITQALAMRITNTTNAHILLEATLYGQPPGASGVPVAMQLTGQPQIIRESTGLPPFFYVLQGDSMQLNLEFAGGNITPSDRFIIGTQDPAVRTAQGGYMAPALITSVPGPAPVVAYSGNVNLDGDPALFIPAGPFPATHVPFEPTQFVRVINGQMPSQVLYDGSSWVLKFGGPLDVGEQLVYIGQQIQGNGDHISNLSPDPITLS